jgi:hypothetical protein
MKKLKKNQNYTLTHERSSSASCDGLSKEQIQQNPRSLTVNESCDFNTNVTRN